MALKYIWAPYVGFYFRNCPPSKKLKLLIDIDVTF
jgi:hypothetical protein